MSPAVSYSKLFRRVQSAREMPDKVEETPEEIMQRYTEAVAKEEEQKVERFVRLLEESTASRKAEIENSFWRRNLQRTVDHPFAFLFIVFGIGIFVILAFRLRPKPKFVIPEGTEDRLDYLEQMIQQSSQKPRPTAKRAASQRGRSARPDTHTDPRLFEI